MYYSSLPLVRPNRRHYLAGMVRICTAVWLMLLLSAFQPAPVNILFLGDSLTAGYGLTTEDAFPAVAGKLLTQKGKKVNVINAGISGDTSAGGLARINWVLKQPVDVLFLELGANDGLRGLPVASTEKNLQAIIDKVRAKNKHVKIVLAGMLVPPNMGKDYAQQFEQVFIRLAARNKCERIPFLLDGVGGNPKLNQADGIHPTVEGHRIVGARVAAVLQKML